MTHTDAAYQLLFIAETQDMPRADRLAEMQALVARLELEAIELHREDQRRTKAIQESRKTKGRGK
jgi:hypothetical protein